MMKKEFPNQKQTKIVWKEYSPRELYELTIRIMEQRIENNRHNKMLNYFNQTLPEKFKVQ